MFERLRGLPAYRVTGGEVSARRYNQVRLALKRWPGPLRLPLAGLRSLEMVLDEDSWALVDTSLDDLPVVAWTEFATRGRDNLHLAIGCRVAHYHAHAGLVMESALRQTELALVARLGPDAPG